MKPKTYRIKGEIAEKAAEKMIEYITEKQKAISEAEIINIVLQKGIDEIKIDEIEEIKRKNESRVHN